MQIDTFQQNIQSHDKLIHIVVQFEQDLNDKKKRFFLNKKIIISIT
jgi:hypothetical protein